MKFLKIIGVLILILIIVGFVAIKLMSQDLPNELQNEDADLMANQMMEALNKSAWDSLGYISFTFRGSHHYFWNKKDDEVLIKWGNKSVGMDLNSLEAHVLVDGKKVSEKKSQKIKDKAWSFWCNDSFWLYAPFKVFDKGVERSVVKMDDGTKGLMVSYRSGGVTPGDKYMWILDENNKPTGWRMWVKIIPVKGVYTSWEGYKTLAGGAEVATEHNNGKLGMKLTNIKSGSSLQDIGMKEGQKIMGQ